MISMDISAFYGDTRVLKQAINNGQVRSVCFTHSTSINIDN